MMGRLGPSSRPGCNSKEVVVPDSPELHDLIQTIDEIDSDYPLIDLVDLPGPEPIDPRVRDAVLDLMIQTEIDNAQRRAERRRVRDA